jgi:hypothetical protein
MGIHLSTRIIFYMRSGSGEGNPGRHAELRVNRSIRYLTGDNSKAEALAKANGEILRIAHIVPMEKLMIANIKELARVINAAINEDPTSGPNMMLENLRGEFEQTLSSLGVPSTEKLAEKFMSNPIITLGNFLASQGLQKEIRNQFKAFKIQGLNLNLEDRSALIDPCDLSEAATAELKPKRTIEGSYNGKKIKAEISYLSARSVIVAFKGDDKFMRKFGFTSISEKDRVFNVFDHHLDIAGKRLIGFDGETVPFLGIRIELAKAGVTLSDEAHWAVFAEQLNMRGWKISRANDAHWWKIDNAEKQAGEIL